MKKTILTLLLLLIIGNSFAQGFKNPVLPGFTGVMLGVFAQGTDKKGYADYDWFEYITKY